METYYKIHKKAHVSESMDKDITTDFIINNDMRKFMTEFFGKDTNQLILLEKNGPMAICVIAKPKRINKILSNNYQIKEINNE